MTESEQQVIDRGAPDGPIFDRDAGAGRWPADPAAGTTAVRAAAEGIVQAGERAARNSLRAQVARLEGELSAILAGAFPFVPAPAPAGGASFGPCLLSLEELERLRDRLAGRLQELGRVASDRAEHERRAHEQLEGMKLEPGRYKFARLPVKDLGQGGCGVWEVRPRLGLIGMLAGWWQVKLSSGCPLAKGSRSVRDPDALQGDTRGLRALASVGRLVPIGRLVTVGRLATAR